jgi:hypothetical protein
VLPPPEIRQFRAYLTRPVVQNILNMERGARKRERKKKGKGRRKISYLGLNVYKRGKHKGKKGAWSIYILPIGGGGGQ